ncbi:MAG: hypothetical protein IMY88_02340 [Chloroflexi bacterium]|nr:hypothetical protein [Chloroflexota bacterium]
MMFLPKLSRGWCGFGNCGQLARAVAEGRASAFNCVQGGLWVAYGTSEIIGVKISAFGYGVYQHAFTRAPT